MKKLLLMIMLVAGINMFANAQTKEHKSPEQKAQHMTKMLQKKLALTTDQSVKVNAILFKRATQMDSLKTNLSTTDRKLNKLSRREIMLGADAEMNTVLTADQQKTYADLKLKFKEKGRGKRSAPVTMPSAG